MVTILKKSLKKSFIKKIPKKRKKQKKRIKSIKKNQKILQFFRLREYLKKTKSKTMINQIH